MKQLFLKSNLLHIVTPESSEPQEKSIESEKYELRRILQMQVNCLREDEMDNSDAVAIRGTTAQRIMKFLDPVSAPSESQEEMWQSSNPNKERYVQLSNVHSDGMPEPWLRFWEQIEIWYGDIQKRETGVQLLERLRKEGFKITRNP